MPIDLHVQTIVGRCDDKEEPSTAWKLDADNFTHREMYQFYSHLKHTIRYIEKIIDEEIEKRE